MKTILYLTIIGAVSAHAQYSSDWSEFDAGSATHQSGAITHSGILSSWHSVPMRSADYEIRHGYPMLPMPVQTLGLPVLTITKIGDHVRVAWPASAANFTLQEARSLDSPAWSGIPGPYQQDGDESFVLIAASGAARFYRLMSP